MVVVEDLDDSFYGSGGVLSEQSTLRFLSRSVEGYAE